MSFGEVPFPSGENAPAILTGAWPLSLVTAWTGYSEELGRTADLLFQQINTQHDIKALLAGQSGAFITTALNLAAGRQTALENRVACYRYLSNQVSWAANELHAVKSDLADLANKAEKDITEARNKMQSDISAAGGNPIAIALAEEQFVQTYSSTIANAKAAAMERAVQGSDTIAGYMKDVVGWSQPYVNSLMPKAGEGGLPGEGAASPPPADMLKTNIEQVGKHAGGDSMTKDAVAQQGDSLKDAASNTNGTDPSKTQTDQNGQKAGEQNGMHGDPSKNGQVQPERPMSPPATSSPSPASSGGSSSGGGASSMISQMMRPASSPASSAGGNAASGANPGSAMRGMPGGAPASGSGAGAGSGGGAGAGGAGGAGAGSGAGASRAVSAAGFGSSAAQSAARMGSGAISSAANIASTAGGVGSQVAQSAAAAAASSAPAAAAAAPAAAAGGFGGGAPMMMAPAATSLAGAGTVASAAAAPAAAAPGAATGAAVPTTAAAAASTPVSLAAASTPTGGGVTPVFMPATAVQQVGSGGAYGDELYEQATMAATSVLNALVGQARSTGYIPMTWAMSLIWEPTGLVTAWLATSEGPSYIPLGVRVPSDVQLAVNDPVHGGRLWQEAFAAGGGDPLTMLARHAELRANEDPTIRPLVIASTLPMARVSDWASSVGARAVSIDPRSVDACDPNPALAHRCAVAMPWEWRQANAFTERQRLTVAARHMRMAALAGHLNGRAVEQVMRSFEEQSPIPEQLWRDVDQERSMAAINYRSADAMRGQGGADPERAFRTSRAAEVISCLRNYNTVEGCADILYATRLAGAPLNPAAAVA